MVHQVIVSREDNSQLKLTAEYNVMYGYIINNYVPIKAIIVAWVYGSIGRAIDLVYLISGQGLECRNCLEGLSPIDWGDATPGPLPGQPPASHHTLRPIIIGLLKMG